MNYGQNRNEMDFDFKEYWTLWNLQHKWTWTKYQWSGDFEKKNLNIMDLE